MAEYSSMEMMAVAAAREIEDGEIVFCGTGISMLAAMAAKHISAPRSVIIFETGAVDSRLEELPLTVADSRVTYRASAVSGLAGAFALMQNRSKGLRVVGIIGAAQIDPYGNLNSTAVGGYTRPDVRFSGSGGACDVASFVSRTILFMQHEKKRFVPRVEYLTSPGWLGGPGERRRRGLPPGGPRAVITDMAVMRFDEGTARMYLDGFYRGIDPRDVAERTGFELDVSRAREVPPPSAEELGILREKCDPQGLILR